MPQRFLRPGLTTSDRWNACSFGAQSLFVRLLTLVDDFGRFDGRIPVIHGSCFALRDDIKPQDSAGFRSELQANGLIDVYQVDGKEYIQVLRWQERARSATSKYPDPVSNPQDSAAERRIPQEKDASLALAITSSTIASTSSPAPVPLPAQSKASELPETISDPNEAKQLICELILKEKNPGRPWSYEATHELARRLPLPRAEITDIARWRSIPKDDAEPALKFRRDVITETTLMRFWGDELLRSRSFLQKINGRAEKKKEPELWRELFVWLTGNSEIVVPDSFWKLGRDQQQEYHDNIEAFQKHLEQQGGEPSSAPRHERAPA